MAFFKAKTGWQRPRKREKKILVPITSYLMRNRKLIKLAIKLKKLKNIFMAFFEAKMGWERPRKREKKIIVPINSYPIRNRKLKKNSKKIQKIKKHRYGFFSSQNGWGEAEKERKKNYRSDQFLPDQEQKIKKKIAKKFKKLKNIVMASFQAKMGQERLARSTSSSLEDILVFKEIQAIIFET